MQMRMYPTNSAPQDFGKPVDFQISPDTYDWGHGGCLKFNTSDIIQGAIASNSTPFDNNDQTTDWLVELTKVDPTCTVGIYIPNIFMNDVPYTEQQDCGKLQYKIGQYGKMTHIPMRFGNEFGIQFCCGNDDCAAMLPGEIVYAETVQSSSSAILPDVHFLMTLDACSPPVNGKGKKQKKVDGDPTYGPPVQVPGKMVYSSQWIDCTGQTESCQIAAVPGFTDTKGTMYSSAASNAAGLSIQTSQKFKLFFLEGDVSVTKTDTFTYTRTVQKDHLQAKSQTLYYTVHCEPGESCAIGFTPRAYAREVKQCMKDGSLRQWIEYENVMALGPTGQAEVQGEYSIIYRD